MCLNCACLKIDRQHPNTEPLAKPHVCFERFPARAALPAGHRHIDTIADPLARHSLMHQLKGKPYLEFNNQGSSAPRRATTSAAPTSPFTS